MPVALMVHDEDPADKILSLAGNLEEIEVFNSQVLVGLYERSRDGEAVKTEGGVWMPHQVTRDDQYQSKVGMILKMGPRAFVDINDPPRWFIDQDDMADGDWVVFRCNEGFPLKLVSRDSKGKKQELLCRLLDDVAIRARIDGPLGPDRIY